MNRKTLNNHSGQAIILYALAIVVLFGFGALAIDIGHIYHVKNQLQVAADAGALAGANELDGTTFRNQTSARSAALRVAFKNTADVAASNIVVPTAAKGQPIPVTLQRNNNNADVNGDVVVGFWDGAVFHPATDDTGTINAVEVNARRTGAIPAQPSPQNWFAKVFKLLGANYDITNISATAIATKGSLPIVPIAVNEYWEEPALFQNGSYVSGGPYPEKYPESFMRMTNADGISAGRGGQTFAILGTNANSNQKAFDLNSYISPDFRNEDHRGLKGLWHQMPASPTGTCSDCPLPLVPGGSVTTGDVDPTKFDTDFAMLFNGLPSTLIPPNAVREVIRRTSPVSQAYGFNNYTTANGNNPSKCPFATVPYFSSSGNIPSLPKGPNGQRFDQKWPTGSKLMVMVYDGTHTVNPPGLNSQANVVTVIGYGIIQIDGYSNAPIKNVSDFGTLNPGGAGTGGDTAYGHAIPHGLTGVDPAVADVSDPFIIQPPSDGLPAPASLRGGSCTFIDILRAAQSQFNNVHLVGKNIRYGVK